MSGCVCGRLEQRGLRFMFGLPAGRRRRTSNSIADRHQSGSPYFSNAERTRSCARSATSTARRAPSCLKPFTPFNGNRRTRLSNLKRNKHLCQIMHIKGVEFNWHTPQVSLSGGVFRARRPKDGRCAGGLRWRLGCRFDGWTDQFSFENWMKAFEQCGVDPAFYANRRREGRAAAVGVYRRRRDGGVSLA